MRITGITTQLYRIPPAVKIEDSIQRVSHWEFLVTTLATDAGLLAVASRGRLRVLRRELERGEKGAAERLGLTVDAEMRIRSR